MSNVSMVIKDGKYFIMPEIFNHMGGTTPVEIIVTGSYDDDDLPTQAIGTDILKCMELGSEYEKKDGWEDPKLLDKKLKTVGYKSYEDLRRLAKFLYIVTVDENIVFYPTKRHGSRSPSFEGIGEVRAESHSPQDVGLAFKQAINLCS